MESPRMSLACGLPLLDSVYCLGCAWWASKRCVHTGTGYRDGATSGHAAAANFAPIRRMCRLVMANYETNLAAPLLDPSNVMRRRTYTDTGGLNLVRESDYALLLDNHLGKRRFDDGYVHNGLPRAAGWVLDKECDLLRDLLDRSSDTELYSAPRFVTHIDDQAIRALTKYYSQALPLRKTHGVAILDMCSSWVSHYPAGYKQEKIVGMGMNEDELKKNPVLTEYVVQDLNLNPKLPFDDNTFDVITNVDKLIRCTLFVPERK
ncbi:hypothetical protein ZWY2020_049112 [Hordeum vulgare]|nr:hypothetical protein ZWY2020_049112 [Hordeum vulgare]